MNQFAINLSQIKMTIPQTYENPDMEHFMIFKDKVIKPTSEEFEKIINLKPEIRDEECPE